MLFKQLQYFQAVVEQNSFSEAAEVCHISQSAISQQIKALENELGVSLLERHNRTFSLTPAGAHFYRKSLVVLSDLEQLRRETVRIAGRDEAHLNIGYSKCYGGTEFQDAVAAFSERYPDVQLHVTNGNHEDLYHDLISGRVDLVLNDQRRAFADDYVNFELVKSHCYIEIAARHPLSRLTEIEVDDLKNITCILVAGREQRQNEQEYYHNIVGFHGDFLFADSLPDARIMVASRQGFLPVEGVRDDVYYDSSIKRIPLFRNGNPVLRNYCAFWKKENSGIYLEAFAAVLKAQFE